MSTPPPPPLRCINACFTAVAGHIPLELMEFKSLTTLILQRNSRIVGEFSTHLSETSSAVLSMRPKIYINEYHGTCLCSLLSPKDWAIA